MPVTAGSPNYDEHEDLAPVLQDIGFGKLATTRAKLANDPTTRVLLDLGLELLQHDLLQHTGPDFDQGDRSRLFESLSRERILIQAQQSDRARSMVLTENMFRNRWPRKDHYTEDLISYLFRLGPQRQHLDKMDADTDTLLGQVNLGDFIRTLAEAEITAMLNDPLVNLQTIIEAALPNHPRVRNFSQAQHEQLLPRWAQLYERVATAYGLTIRSAYTWHDVALLFNAIVEGALVRARVDRVAPTLSNGEGVLAAAIFAMLPTLMDGIPADWGTRYARSMP